MPRKKEKAMFSPIVCAYHDGKDENLIVQVELPGVKKKDVSLNMTDEGFCVSGERADFIYQICYSFLHEITPAKARAKFGSGLLTITVPFRKPAKARQIAIE